MKSHELENILVESLEDFKLDNVERDLFKGFSKTLSADQLAFLRNKAFDLSRDYIEAGGTDAIKVHHWLSRVVKSVQPLTKKTLMMSEAYFSPGIDCRNKIISLLNAAKQSIDICVFTISDNKITDSILNAYKRGIDVCIISDNDKANDRGSDIYRLSEEGVNVVLDKTRYHMHHKFAIFDNKVLLNGSFNWTRSATDVNEENILITADKDLLKRFQAQFSKLKKDLS